MVRTKREPVGELCGIAPVATATTTQTIIATQAVIIPNKGLTIGLTSGIMILGITAIVLAVFLRRYLKKCRFLVKQVILLNPIP